MSSGGQPSGGANVGAGGRGGYGGVPSGGGKGGYGGVPSGGVAPVSGSAGSVECFDDGCYRRCWWEGIGPYAVGDYYYPFQYPDPRECSRCDCQPDGNFVCDDAACPTDCEYLESQYHGAFGQAQYCLLNAQPDPCTPRVLSEDLDCFCPTPVATNTRYFELSQARAQDWLDQGCKKPNTPCPPCPSIGSGVPYCDQDESVCRYR